MKIKIEKILKKLALKDYQFRSLILTKDAIADLNVRFAEKEKK